MPKPIRCSQRVDDIFSPGDLIPRSECHGPYAGEHIVRWQPSVAGFLRAFDARILGWSCLALVLALVAFAAASALAGPGIRIGG